MSINPWGLYVERERVCDQLSCILIPSTQGKILELLFPESLSVLGSGSVRPKRGSWGALEDWRQEVIMSQGQLFAGTWAFGRCLQVSPWEPPFLVPQAVESPTTAPCPSGQCPGNSSPWGSSWDLCTSGFPENGNLHIPMAVEISNSLYSTSFYLKYLEWLLFRPNHD